MHLLCFGEQAADKMVYFCDFCEIGWSKKDYSNLSWRRFRFRYGWYRRTVRTIVNGVVVDAPSDETKHERIQVAGHADGQ